LKNGALVKDMSYTPPILGFDEHLIPPLLQGIPPVSQPFIIPHAWGPLDTLTFSSLVLGDLKIPLRLELHQTQAGAGEFRDILEVTEATQETAGILSVDDQDIPAVDIDSTGLR